MKEAWRWKNKCKATTAANLLTFRLHNNKTTPRVILLFITCIVIIIIAEEKNLAMISLTEWISKSNGVTSTYLA